MEKTRKVKRFLALALAVVMVVGLMPHGANAQTIADGSKTCTVKAVDRNHFLTTDKGTRLGASYAEYTTNDGLTGPAYCIDHGLKYSSGNLEIRGVYDANPETAAAFAQSYPQHSLETFLGRYPKESLLKGLTEEEYAYATQLAIWATLGQLAVEGTKYTNGRETVPQPVGDEQQIRVFRTLQLICESANWSGVPKTGMIVRAEEESLGANVALPSNMTLEKAAESGQYGIKKETIGGKEYYTREFTFASATSTYYSGYNIELWAEGAPEGTIFASLDNVELGKGNYGGKSTWVLPTDVRYYDLMGNGFEYSNRAKLCIPVEAAKNSGEITVCCVAYVMQYQIYLAYNKNSTQQSYIIADPSKGNLTAKGSLSWGGEETEKGSLRVTKTDEAGQPLAGAKFILSGSDGSSKTGETNENGVILWELLDPNVEYTLTETQAPAGYMVVEPQKVTVIANQITDVTVQDPLGPKLTVKKVDAQTGYSLRDAVIAFEQIDGDYYTTATTDQAGSIVMDVETLPLGSYKVYEVTAPEGYELNSTPQTVNWDGTQDITLTFNNVRKPTIEIYKCDENNLRSLPDATFEVYRNGQLVTTVTTNDNGLAYVPGVTTGYYTIKEVAAPEGYVADGREYGVYVDNYDPATTDDPRITVTNAEKPSLTILKYDAQTMKPVPDVTFEVYHDGQLLGSYTTDASGKIELSSLDPGTYLVKEIAAKGYVVNSTPQEIEIEAGSGRHTLTFLNLVKPGIHLVKLDSQTMQPLAGAKFRISKIGGDFSKEYTTDASGEIDLSELDPCAYEVVEISAPDGYLIDEARRVIELVAGENAEFVFTDTKRPVLILEKYDAHDGKPLAGATFRIAPINDPDHYIDKVTDAQGRITLEGLEAGMYSVQELNAPEGYVLDSTEHHVKLYPGETSTLIVVNEKRPALRIVKYDAQTKKPLPDTTFEVYRDSELIGTYTTDANGEILLYDLTPGTYLVKEVAAPDTHVLNSTPQEIELAAGQTGTLIFLNYVKPGIYLVKLDSQTFKPLANAKFRITQVGGDFSQEYTTDANGEIDLSGLEPGSYTVEELAAPDGYLIDDAQRIIKIEGGEYAQFVFTNTRKPTFRLVKLDSLTGKRLPGATFRIAKVAEGTHYLDRITDTNGEIVIDDLEPGIYSVLEMTAPEGYVRNPLEYHVELVPGRQAQLVVSNAQKPNLIIVKRDADTGEPVPGTVFEVRAADGHSVDEVKTDKDGRAVLENLLPGVYEITEKYVPSPYLMDADSQLVTLYSNRDHTVYFENHKKPTLTVNKIDSVTGSPIEGAKFEVWYGSNSTTTGELNDLGTFYSDSNGQFFVDELRDGWYRVTELEPAAGYTMKEPFTQEFYIRGGESKTVTFENTPKNAIVVEKYDSVTGEALAGCTFQLRYLGGTSGTGGTVIGSKVTGKNGVAMWTGLNPGTYIVEEIDPADGYNIIQSSETILLADNGEQSVVTVRFLNSPDGMLLVRKVCSVNPSVTLPGAEFKITYADGTLIGDSNGLFTTDEKGEIRLTGLKPGKSVIVTETRAPAGFIIDSQSQTAQIKEGRVVSLTFRNQPKGAIVVKKVDSATGKPLSGAEFRITTSAGCEVGLNGVIGTSTLTQNGIFTTGSNGEIKVSNLAPGTYVLTELKAPDGYVMDAASTNVVIGNGGDTQIVTVKNSKAGTLIVDKRDSRTGKPLEGVQFRITTASGEFVPDENGRLSSNGIYFTNKDGQIVLHGVVGTLVVTETVALPGYTMDNRPQTVVVDPNDTQTLYFTNTPSTTLVIEKYIEGTTTPLKGVTFLVTDSSGAVVGKSNGEYITDENGRIVIEDLTPGTTVVAKEIKTLDGFVLDTTPKSILIKEGEVQTLRFYNKAKGTLVIQKKDSVTGALLSGAKFQLTYADGSFVDYDNGHMSSKGIYVTDENGEIRVYGVVGTIVAKELEAAPGYVIDPKTQTVTVNAEDTQTLVFRNEPLVSLTITKLDSVTGKPVSGAEFTVRDSYGNLLGKYVTGKDGTVTVTGLIPGTTLIVHESGVPKGYVLDPTPKVITVRSGSNSVSTGAGNDLVFENDPTVSLVIEKYIDGTTTPLQGVTFLVTDSSGKVIGGSNGEYITDEFGRIVIRDLEPGSTVVAREVKTVDGYVLDTTPKTIEIKAGEAQTLRFYNKAEGTLIVQKKDKQTGEPLAGVEFEITYSDGSFVDADYGHLSSKGLYKTDANGEIRIPGVVGTVVVTETKPLEGYVMDEGTRSQTVVVNPGDTQTIVVYNTKVGGLTIIKKDAETGTRIKGVRFEIRKMNGEIVGTYTTDSNGVIYLPEAEKGWYVVTELAAADGYKLDDTPHRIEVKDGQTATLEITNRKSASALIHKVDSVTGKGIYGVTFLLSDAKGNPVGTYQSDNNGYVYIDKELADGKYTIREIECAEGYILDTQPKTVYIEYGSCATITWKNTPVTGQIQITKTSADYNSMNGWPAGTLIPGTVFEIYNYRTGNLMDTVVTNKNGVATSKPLPLGRYKIVESKAADFYALDKTPIEVEIEHSGQIVKVAVKNKSLYTNVSIQKAGYAEVMPGQNIRYTFSNIGNNSSTSLTSFYWRDMIPVDAVRLAKVTTGTYNAVGNYKVVYKTNTSGDNYLVLADSLDTRRNYVLDASPTALRLASNEYVTEVMFVFGVVPANFRQVEAPKIDCTVGSWVKNASQFVNQADAGGVYNGQWIQAVTRWVTKVYAPTQPLPRTGY